MKIAKILFKRNWQDKDAAVRASAVAHDDDADLIAALPQLAREDADASVRLAALRRLDDIELWHERADADADSVLRASARRIWLERLCASDATCADFDRLDATQIENLACNARTAALRGAALQRVTRSNVLADRAINDSDAGLRRTALERIDDPALLERIAERTRKSDKAISRIARERVHGARVEAGDVDAIVAQARALCTRLEEVLRAPGATFGADLCAIDAQWHQLGNAVPEALQRRFQGVRRAAEHAHALLSDPQAMAELVTQTLASNTVSQAAPSAPAPVIVSAPASEESKAQKKQRHNERDALQRQLDAFEAALERGDNLAATQLQSSLRAAFKSTLPSSAQGLSLRFEALRERLAKLREWQHWSNQKRRGAMCAEVEALAASAAHPDALTTRIRELRTEWERLDTAEGLDPQTATRTGIARRFHGLCHRVLRPTRAYFAARKELRHSNTESINQLLAQVDAIANDATDWSGMARLRTQARDALHRLDGVEAAARTELARRLKLAIGRLGGLCDAHAAHVSQAKHKLIEQASALGTRAPTSGAARETAQLRRQWQALGQGNRRQDQTLWKQFDAACNAVFANLDTERKAQTQRDAQARRDAESLLTRFGELAAARDRPAAAVRIELRELDAQWQALNVVDRTLVKQQQMAHASIQAFLTQAQREQRLEKFATALDAYAKIRRAEDVPDHALASDWDACVPAPFVAALRTRAATFGHVRVADGAAARDILVQLEILAGIESPAEDRQRLMKYQVQRLSSHLRDARPSADPELQLQALMLAWFEQSPASTELESRFAAAARKALQSLP